MRKFAIYYNNGDVVKGGGDDDEEITLTFSKKWLEAPSDGVCCVVAEVPTTGRSVHKLSEYYYQMPINQHGDGDIGNSMKIGAYLRQMHNDGGIVKFGGWTSDPNYAEIMARAANDTYIQTQAGKKREITEDEAD